MRTIAKTMCLCPLRGIVHRGHKPENVLLSKKGQDVAVTLVDFEFAKHLNTDKARAHVADLLFTACRSPSYVAPGILSGWTCGAVINCWSLNVITYILLCGCGLQKRGGQQGVVSRNPVMAPGVGPILSPHFLSVCSAVVYFSDSQKNGGLESL